MIVHTNLTLTARVTLPVMPTRPEELHPALTAAYNAGDLESMLALYDPNAVFVIKPGRVTNGPAELRVALQRLIELRGNLTIHPHTFVRSDDVALVLGDYTLSGHRRDGTPFELESHFADVLRRQPNGRWLMAVDNGTNA
jgi:ketosteroid isomerase-like protein